MLSGSETAADVRKFQNDPAHFRSKDDILAYLIHPGYPGCDQQGKCAFVPNEEVREELTLAVNEKKWSGLQDLLKRSDEFLQCVLNKDEKSAGKPMGEIHGQYVPAVSCNHENSLSAVLTVALLSSMQYYFRPVNTEILILH